jgi:hypothetical protein
MPLLKGSLWALILYDVSEEIRLDQVRDRLGAGQPTPKPEFRHAAPEYVRFARPPVAHPLGEVSIGGARACPCLIKFYDYGVVSVALEIPFEGDWAELVELCGRSIPSPEIERRTLEIARGQLQLVPGALVKPYENWTSEDYYVIHIREAASADGGLMDAREMLDRHGGDIAQIVRGETAPLSDPEQHEILQQWLSYYPSDLVIVGWMAAFVYDTPEGGSPVIQLLEYANTQLIVFRYYDELLTKVLADVYRRLERRRKLLGRWTMAREAERLNRIRLDVIELTERVDNSIKFLSDMYYARAYRLAARKIGVIDYRDLVDEKLKTAADLYRYIVEEFHQSRAFVLEAMVVAILLIELFYLFRGKG